MPVVYAMQEPPTEIGGFCMSRVVRRGPHRSWKGVLAVSKHRARTLLGSGVFRFTTDKGAVYLPLKPDLLAIVTALHARPVISSPRLLGRRRNIVILAR